jgi:hypothetical protein
MKWVLWCFYPDQSINAWVHFVGLWSQSCWFNFFNNTYKWLHHMKSVNDSYPYQSVHAWIHFVITAWIHFVITALRFYLFDTPSKQHHDKTNPCPSCAEKSPY